MSDHVFEAKCLAAFLKNPFFKKKETGDGSLSPVSVSLQEDENILDTGPHFKSCGIEYVNPLFGPWGQLRCDYLEEERHGEHWRLVMKDILDQALIEINEVAEKQIAELIHKMQKSEGVTDKPKAENRNEWILRMNGIRARAADIVKTELIFK